MSTPVKKITANPPRFKPQRRQQQKQYKHSFRNNIQNICPCHNSINYVGYQPYDANTEDRKTDSRHPLPVQQSISFLIYLFCHLI